MLQCLRGVVHTYDALLFRCAAGHVTSGDLGVERCVKEFAAKLKLLLSWRGVGGSVCPGTADCV